MSTRRQSAELKARELKRHIRKTYSAEEKVRIVLLGLKGDTNINELCQKEGINVNLFHVWNKEFLEAGRSRLAGEFWKEDLSEEMQVLKSENTELKQLVAELILEVRRLQKSGE